ncbi:hypothetical protein GCM10020000_20610 [Streptomyces olivoverticillatus]
MAPGAARGVAGHVAEQGADLAGGVGDAVQGAAAEERDAAPSVESQHQTQGGGLARAGLAEQCGDVPGTGLEGEVVDGGGAGCGGGDAGQSDGLDHGLPSRDDGDEPQHRNPICPICYATWACGARVSPP